jgi:hypothetical protein
VGAEPISTTKKDEKIGSSLRIVVPKNGNVELCGLPIGLVRSSLDRIMDPEMHQRTAWVQKDI